MRKLYTALAAIAFSTAGAHAQQPLKLSLQECIDYALKNSYTMKNAHLDVLIQQEQVKQTTAAALPHVNGKADFMYANIVQSQFIDAGTFAQNDSVRRLVAGRIVPVQFSLPYAGSATITTSQVLFDGSVLVALQAKNTIVELARRSEHATAQEVRYNIYKSYNSLVIAYKQFDLIKGSLKLARQMEDDLIKTRAAGFAEKIDVERTSVQINNLATDSLRVSNSLMIAEQVLKYQMGLAIGTPIMLTDTALEKNANSVIALMAEKENYEQVPQYTVLKAALQLNEYNVKRFRMSALPSLSAFWAYGANYGSNKLEDIFKFNNYYPSSMIGVSLNAPIFNGFARQHQVNEAKLNVEKTRNNIDNLKLTIDFQAALARTTLKNSLLQVQSQRRNLELANSVIDLAQRKYKAGVGSNLEVTTAQTDLIRAQNNYFQSLLDVANAEADLRKALGLLK